MVKGPLVKAAVLLAAMLMVMSIAIAAFPEQLETIGAASVVVAVAVVAVLLLMLFRMRKARSSILDGLEFRLRLSALGAYPVLGEVREFDSGLVFVVNVPAEAASVLHDGASHRRHFIVSFKENNGVLSHFDSRLYS